MASFVAGCAKTDYPTYLEKHRKQQRRTADGVRKSIKDFHPVTLNQSENGKAEKTMKKYIKPRMRFLGLLRLVTKLSF
jgi:hypothetical protein